MSELKPCKHRNEKGGDCERIQNAFGKFPRCMVYDDPIPQTTEEALAKKGSGVCVDYEPE